MANITYDSKSFIIDEKRVWIVAGETHYFRLPHAEWRPALIRAKRAGLNTIASYVAWNYHEQAKGNYDFEGDRDLGRFIDMAWELGLYVMIRPGPYICSEWDGGGIPGWLCAEGVLRYREDDPVFMDFVTRWFDRLLPVIASRQITKGGPVITIQNENEFPGGWDPSMRGYIEKLNGIFRANGIEIPVLACNVHAASNTRCKINDAVEPADQILPDDMILTFNHHVDIDPLYDLKRVRPNEPSIVTEFWSGPPVNWDRPAGTSEGGWPSNKDLCRAAYEFTSAGAQLCTYMFEGGTNFGFYGGCNIATSYASCYPVGDGGKLFSKYYAMKPVWMFSNTFGAFIASSAEVEENITCPEGVRLTVRRAADEADGAGLSGAMVFVSAHDGRKCVRLNLPGSERKLIDICWDEVEASVHPLGLRVAGAVVDYSNLCLLAQRKNTLTLYGPAGTEGVVSVNGREMTFHIPRYGFSWTREDGIRLVVCSVEMARRCWLIGDQLVFGPDYVDGDGRDDTRLLFAASSPGAWFLDEDGDMRTVGNPTASLQRAARAEPPAFDKWRMLTYPEPMESDGWTPISAPQSHERLGATMGYIWYRAKWESPSASLVKLLLPNTPNRVSIFVNGKYYATHAAGRCARMRDDYIDPTDWAFEQLTVEVEKGVNDFVFLSDNQGHNYDVPIPVGIQGPVFAGSREEDVWLREVPPSLLSGEAFNFLYSRWYRNPEPLPGVEFEINLPPDREAFVVIHGIHAWVEADGADILPMSWPESPWTMFPQIKRWITWRIAGGTRKVCVRYMGRGRDIAEHMMIYSAPTSGRLGEWEWKTWEPITDFPASASIGDTASEDGLEVLLPVESYIAGKCKLLRPACFEARFGMPEGDRPLYFNTGEMRKGQLYLNGHNLGRFWRFRDAHELYYLPRSLMEEENRLVVFEELGVLPRRARLVFGDEARSAVKLY